MARGPSSHKIAQAKAPTHRKKPSASFGTLMTMLGVLKDSTGPKAYIRTCTYISTCMYFTDQRSNSPFWVILHTVPERTQVWDCYPFTWQGKNNSEENFSSGKQARRQLPNIGRAQRFKKLHDTWLKSNDLKRCVQLFTLMPDPELTSFPEAICRQSGPWPKSFFLLPPNPASTRVRSEPTEEFLNTSKGINY